MGAKLEDIFEKALQEAVQTPMFARYLAEAMCADKELLEKVIERISVEKLAQEIIRHTTYLSDTGVRGRHSSSVVNYKHVLRESERIAAQKIAETIQIDVAGA